MPTELLPRQNISSTEIGDNPFFNLFDQSMRFISDTISVSRNSYELSFNLVYHSRMPQSISNRCLGLPDRFKTNYHQFLIEDGEDDNEHPIYKYIDDFGYIHTFYYVKTSLYFCNESNLYLYFDEDSSFMAEIVNSKNDKLYFDDYGRLVQIVNGFDDTNIKTIVYDANGFLTRVRDERDTSTYINFSYTDSKLSYIILFHNIAVANRLHLKYTSNFLTSMSIDAVFNDERELYSFHYNSDLSIPDSSFDRIDYLDNHQTHDVYEIHYDYINLYNDFLVTALSKGYYHPSDGLFTAIETIQRIGYSLRTDDWVTTNEVSVIKNGVSYSYSMDKNAHITAVFNGLSSDNFATLYKETGVYIPITGNTQHIYVNNHRFIRVTSPISLSFSSDAISLLNNYKYFVLRFYLRLNDYTPKRVRAIITGTNISSSPVDINVLQFDKYQLVEVPITRNINNISSLTITLSFINENNNSVSVDIGDIYFDKKAKTTLFFKDANGTHSFDEVTSVGLYPYYYSQTPSRIIDVTGEIRMSPNDLLNTISHQHNCFDLLYGNYSPHAHPLYFNDGRVVDSYNFRFCLFNGNDIIFNSFNCSNFDIDSEQDFVWYFETVSPDRTILSSENDTASRVYYSFIDDILVITTRYGTYVDGVFHKISEEIKTYDYHEKLIEKTSTEYKWSGNPLVAHVVSTNTTTYEYFTNGELKKVISTDGIETIVLYEASENNKGFISRKTSDKNSVDITYGRYGLSSIVRNTVSGSTILNSYYSKQYIYNINGDGPVNTKFCLNDNIECINTNSINYVNNTQRFSNSATKYQAVQSTMGKGITYKVLESDDTYSSLYSILENGNNTLINYPSYLQLVYQRNNYKKLTHIRLNSENKVDYSYANSGESYFASNLTSITDKHNDASGLVTSFTYDQIDNSLITTNFNNDEFIIDEGYYINGTIYDFGLYDMSFIHSVDETEIRLEDHTYHNVTIHTFNIQKDNFGRAKKHYSVFAAVTTNCLISDITYINGSSLPYNFTFGINEDETNNTIIYPFYLESYSYDIFGNLSNIYTNGESFPRFSYNYDGFGRIIEEYNVSIAEYNRSYAYDSFGRLSSVDNDSLIYDVKGRLTSFGSITFTYDAYGNRLTKGNETYQWTRGTLLSQFVKGNQTVQFTYDYQNRRYQKKINNSLTITYYYHDNRLIGEKRSDNKEIRYFYDETGIVGFNYYNGSSSTSYRYVKNPFNQIIGIVDKMGSFVARYIYDAWGNHKVLTATGDEDTNMSSVGNINPIRYKGYYYDVETGLFYLFARYYDPSIMQFISPDEFQYLNQDNISGFHLYAYCNNNPVNYCDPSGHFPQLAKWAIGIGVIGILAIATVATAGIAGVGVGAAFAAGFSGAAIGVGASGLAVTIAGSAFAGAVIGAGIGLVGGGIAGAIGTGTWNGALEGAANGFMMGSITGAISGGIRGGINYARTTPLLRSVSSQELNSIRNSGQFSSSRSMESKWFATTKGNAAKWGNAFGQNDFVGIRVLKSALKNNSVYYLSMLDDIGAAYCIDNAYLNAIIHSMWFF